MNKASDSKTEAEISAEALSNLGLNLDLDLDVIDHIAIPVKDKQNLDETVEFYLKTFQCKVLYRDDTWAFLRFGNIKLAFVLPNQHPPHIAFISERAEEFGTLKTHRDGTRSIYVTDPAANTIEVMAPLTDEQKQAQK